MKTFSRIRISGFIAALLIFVAAIVLFVFLPSPTSDEHEPRAAPREERTLEVVEGATVNITTDPELVFKRAFWRRPGAEDTVLDAERLEWVNDSGEVVKWQWFLVVEPSAATREWFADNPFGLLPGRPESDDLNEAYHPEWYPTRFEGHNIFVSANRRHKLAISKDGKRLYGTDSGFGFTQPNLVETGE